MTSIETSTFSGSSADIANTAVFVPEEPTHQLSYVFTTPKWHDDFIGWSRELAAFLESTGLTARPSVGGAGGVPGTELVYTSNVKVFARPGADLLLRLPNALPQGDWKLTVTSLLDEDAEPVTYDFAEDANSVQKL